MQALRKLWARIVVIVKAAPTWLTLAAVILNSVSDEIAGILPTDAAAAWGSFAISAGSWIAAAIAIIRRVTPVLPDERGILPTR